MLIYKSTWNTGDDPKDWNKTNIVIIIWKRERQAREMVWQEHNRHQKWKYKTLHVGRNSLMLCAGDIQLESSFAEKNLEIVVDT